MLDFRILYFQDCPNFAKACQVVSTVIEKYELPASFSLVPVTTDSDLEAMGFYGSPTVQLNGIDVELCYYKSEREVMTELGCRLYNCDHGAGCPSEAMLMCALDEIANTGVA